ncbi:MAG: type II/IV secretion system ATPase subunit [Candidatus Diapherotrites archaeon]
MLEKGKALELEEIEKKLDWKRELIEKTAKVLEKKGLLELMYPSNIFSKPHIKLKQKLEWRKEKKVQGNILSSYRVSSDFISAEVKIIEDSSDRRPFYDIFIDRPCPYTEAFLEEIKEHIARKIPVEVEEITDEKRAKALKEKFFYTIKKELGDYFQGELLLNELSGYMIHSMYGIGDMELLMADNFLEEIVINSSATPIAVYHREFGWMKSNLQLFTEEEIFNYSSQIGRKVGREITNLAPILDAHLVSGDRVNATLYPVSSYGNTITIRKFARKPWTVIDFIEPERHTMNSDIAALLWLSIQYEMNLMVAGSTASGKTSALNTLCALIPNYHRIITIEDVRELMLPEYLKWNWVALTTRNANPEGLGEISMFDLMMSSLRMRPDRIVLGEMRQRKEAEVLFEAMHTGHSVYSTIHADSGTQVIRRLLESPIEIPPLEVEALHLVLVQYRDRKTNRRRTFELSEIESGVSPGQLSVNTIFRWRPREDAWEKVNEPAKLYSELNLHTGMTEQEINSELEDRKRVLEWMLEQKMFELNDVGNVMKLFYSEPETIKKAAFEGRAFSKL